MPRMERSSAITSTSGVRIDLAAIEELSASRQLCANRTLMPPFSLLEIVRMHRRAELEHHVVGDVDDGADGAQARTTQALLHPERRGGVRANAADDAADELVATDRRIGRSLPVSMRTANGSVIVAATGFASTGGCNGLPRAAATSRATPRTLIAFAAIRREVHFENRVIEPERADERLPRATKSAGRSYRPDASSLMPSSRAEHNMPDDSTPRSLRA